MSNMRARSLRRLKERQAVSALIELVEVAHDALHVLLRVADASGNAEQIIECRQAARELAEAIDNAMTL